MINNYKKYLILSFLISLILTACAFSYFTYAKYITSITGDAEVSVARWRVLVNNQDVSAGSSFSNTITPVFTGNTNIAPNVIAPTAEGYFDIVLDVTDTDVSLSYEITTSENSDSAVDDLIISGYSIDGGPRQNITTTANNNESSNENNGETNGENGDGQTGETGGESSGNSDTDSTSSNVFMITGNILYNSSDREVEIRVFLKWNDDTNLGATMDNFDDADAASVATNKAKVNVNIRVIQLPTN